MYINEISAKIDGHFYFSARYPGLAEVPTYSVDSYVTGRGTDGKRYSVNAAAFSDVPSPPNILVNAVSLAPAEGSNYTATAGSIHEAMVSSDLPYATVAWHVKAPGDTTENGTLVETHTGDGLLTKATLRYTFPTGVTGDYTITAVVTIVLLEDLNPAISTLSYVVNVTLPPGLYRTTPYSFSLYGLGETLDFLVIADSPYNEVNWYLKKKDKMGLGTWLYANSGSDAETEGTFSYTFSSENGIEPYTDYILTARVERNSDNTNYNLTYEVNIGP